MKERSKCINPTCEVWNIFYILLRRYINISYENNIPALLDWKLMEDSKRSQSINLIKDERI